MKPPSQQIKRTLKALQFFLIPPERLTNSGWAEKYRYLSPEASSAHGKFSFDLTPWCREIMDSEHAPGVAGVVCMMAAQIGGKTEMLNNVCGKTIDIDPCPMLVMQPTLDMGKSWSKDRLSTMIRDSGRLRSKIKEARSRDSGNTLFHKRFPGGHITVCGANSAASLASRPIRKILFDEVDRYPLSAGTEGDPIKLAEKRTESFPDSFIFAFSTPLIDKVSRIQKLWEESDKRFWHCACHKCGLSQKLEWAQVQWGADKTEDAWYECINPNCKAHWNDEQRRAAVSGGHWVASAPFKRFRGYHLNGIYALFGAKKGYRNRLHQMVEEFLEAKRGGLETLQTWWNTFKAECWSSDHTVSDPAPLLKRREKYGKELPPGILCLAAGVDVQAGAGGRIEVEVLGMGAGEETWGVDYQIFLGNPAEGAVWGQLDEYLKTTWRVEGQEHSLPIACAAVDSGDGNHTKYVYDFCRPRAGRRIYAIKGRSGQGAPLISQPRLIKNKNIFLYTVGVDTGKSMIMGRLKIEKPGPGFMHFPEIPQYGAEYFKGLISEVPKYVKFHGHYKIVWEKTYSRNEPLDCRNYALAAFAIMNPNFSVLLKKVASRPKVYELKLENGPKPEDTKTEPTEPEQPKPARPVRRISAPRRTGFGRGFASKWR